MARRLCLITGASSGIGAAMARVYAAEGWDVALTARREDRLGQLCDEIRLRFGVEAHTLPADLADPDAPEKLYEAVKDLGRTVDGLVNNAGYGMGSSFAGNTLPSLEDMLRVMLLAPTQLCHRVLPDMIAQRFGRILNVASLAGYLPGSPGDTLYGPIKSYLIRFSQGLNLEVRDQDVHVSAVCPGYTHSEFHASLGTIAKLSKAAPAWAWMTSEEVAREGYMAAEANRPVCVPGAPSKVASALLKILPDEWTMELVSGRIRDMSR